MRIGRHISISDGIVTTPDFANSMEYSIYQIFLGTPRQVLSKPRTDEELIKLGKKLKKLKINIVIHGSYTINLCQPKNSAKFQVSLKSLIQDLNATQLIGSSKCLGVIIHMGKNIKENKISDEQAIKNYVIGLKKALMATDPNTRIILETGASQGTEIASKIDGLSDIYWKLTKKERARIYFCIDTCHIWATGYDISNKKGVKKFFDEFEEKIGIDKIICIHFNDSKTDLGSCVDRHADIALGKIGGRGLRAVAKFAQKNDIPIVMETPLKLLSPQQELQLVKTYLN